MKNVKAKVAAGATVICLGGLGGLALSQGGQAQNKPVADRPLVHTKVIHRTIHVTKHAQPKYPPASAPVEPASAGSPLMIERRVVTTIVPSPGQNEVGSGPISSSPSYSSGAAVTTGAS